MNKGVRAHPPKRKPSPPDPSKVESPSLNIDAADPAEAATQEVPGEREPKFVGSWAQQLTLTRHEKTVVTPSEPDSAPRPAQAAPAPRPPPPPEPPKAAPPARPAPPPPPEPGTPESAPLALLIPPAAKVPPVLWRDPQPLFAPLGRLPVWTHDLQLLGFGNQGDSWALQDAWEGTFILGATGSGKTTGSGRALANAFLDSHFGGLVLTVKPDEAKLWEAYARKTGREGQLCVIRPGSPFRFNFLDYESRRPGVGGGLIENLVSLFYTIIDAGVQNQQDSQLVNFWTRAGKQLVRNTFRVLTLATPRLSLPEASRFVIESPKRMGRKIDDPIKKGPWFTQCLNRAIAQAKGTPQEAVIDEAVRYWTEDFLDLAPDTRSCIVAAFTAMADTFIEPAIHELFCTDTTIIPEAVLDGAIIVIDLPLKNYDAVGMFAQSIWKYLFQKAIERRADPDGPTRRPVFLWVDEAQYFHSAYDGLFQTTARSARCATVYLTQNISNFYGITGASRSRERVDGFLGSLNTKIFHCNNDHTSNVWAADQIGKSIQYRFSSSSSTTTTPGKGFLAMMFPSQTHGGGMNEVIDYEVQPSMFLNLRTGGPRFDFLVDAYFIKGGAIFSSGKHYFPTVFQQEFSS